MDTSNSYCPECDKYGIAVEGICPNCGYPLKRLDKGANDNHLKRKKRKRIDGTKRDYKTYPVKLKPETWRSVIALILSISGVLSPIGIGLAIIDLIVSRGHKYKLSLAAIYIGCIWIILAMVYILFRIDSYQ